MAELGYVADVPFNQLRAHQRQYFVDIANERLADVFINSRMCHVIDLRDRHPFGH